MRKDEAKLEALRKRTARLLSRYLDDLPVLPSVAQVLASEPTSVRGLGDSTEALARLDPTLAMRMCFLARGQLVQAHGVALTISSILARAGTDRIRKGIGQLAKKNVFQEGHAAVRELWLHSLQVALVARYLAATHPQLQVHAEEAYLLGLLHDIGRFILLAADPSAFAALEERDWASGEDLVAQERSILGYDHAELGMMACARWKLPPLLQAVIQYHHRQGLPGDDHGVHRLIGLVRVADAASLVMIKHPDALGNEAYVREYLLEEQKAGASLVQLQIEFGAVARSLPALHQRSVDLASILFRSADQATQALPSARSLRTDLKEASLSMRLAKPVVGF